MHPPARGRRGRRRQFAVGFRPHRARHHLRTRQSQLPRHGRLVGKIRRIDPRHPRWPLHAGALGCFHPLGTNRLSAHHPAMARRRAGTSTAARQDHRVQGADRGHGKSLADSQGRAHRDGGEVPPTFRHHRRADPRQTGYRNPTDPLLAGRIAFPRREGRRVQRNQQPGAPGNGRRSRRVFVRIR